MLLSRLKQIVLFIFSIFGSWPNATDINRNKSELERRGIRLQVVIVVRRIDEQRIRNHRASVITEHSPLIKRANVLPLSGLIQNFHTHDLHLLVDFP